MRTVMSWVAVHQVGPGLLLLGLSLVMSLAFGSALIDDIGVIQLAVPVSALLIVPVIAGVGAAMGPVDRAPFPLPDPLRAAMARLLAVVLMTGAGVAVSLAGLLTSDGHSPGPIVRNVLLHVALALAVARIDERVMWIPGLVLTLLAMLFGEQAASGEAAPWAFVIDERVKPWQWALVAVLTVVALVAHARPAHGLRPARR